MASQIKIDLSVQDTSGSLKKRTSETQALNKELAHAQKLAGATKPASQAVKSSFGGIQGEGTAYGQARGSMGATGASARDFANQAQGLGGLVRLYATWAANVFAVSAAFSALSNAANVTNMIQGMNQLGISSGIALGSMAQRFVEASDGAISLKDAVSATVKAVSSGLSQAQFEQLGKVANNASKALGIDMADAVSRLTRGITKLEPELLDELGIFTKVGTATEEYAKRIGKAAGSLTDFERRQAFANAVLAEGTQKFGNIKIDANPYDQLAASLTNLSNKVLGFVNTALGPLIGLLSSSPTALLEVVGGLGSLLLKQAIPAIGQYKNALAASADESEKKWQQKSDAIKKIEKDQFQYMINMSEAEADSKLASFEKAEQRLKRSKSKSQSGVFDERSQSILQGTTLSKEDRDYLKGKQAEAAAAGNRQLASAYKEARIALDKWIISEKEHEKILQQISVQTNKNIDSANKFSAAGFARDELNRAKVSKSRSALISQAAEDASTDTIVQSWQKLNKGIKEEKLTGASGALTKIGGAAAIATTVISRAASVLMGFFGTIGIVVGVLSTLYSFVSTNGKEAEALASAIDQADEAARTATGTFEKFNNTLSSESLMAKANATVGLVDAMDKLVDKFLEFDKASGFIDSAWEKLKGIVGLSKQDDVAKGLSTNIMKVLENLDDPGLKKDFETRLKSLLSIDEVNFDKLDDALEKIDPKKLKQLTKDTEELKVKNQATAAAISQVGEGFKNVTTAFTALENTLKPNDPISTFASAIAKQSILMAQAFENPKIAATTFQDVLKDTSKLNAFPPDAAAQILAAANNYNSLSVSIQDSKDKIAALQAELDKGAGSYTGLFTSRRDALKLKVEADQKSIIDLSSVMQKAASTGLDYAFKISLAKLNSATAQAGIDQQKGLLAALPKSEATIKAQMTLENKSIDIRKQEIQAIYSLTQEMKITRTSSKVTSLQEKIAELPESKASELPALQKELSLAQAEENIYRNKIARKDVPEELRGAYFEQSQLTAGMRSQLNVLNINKVSNEQKAALDIKLAQFEKDNKLDAEYVKNKQALRDKELSKTTLTIEERAKAEADFLEQTKEQRLRQATIAERQAISSAQGVIDVVTKPAMYGISGKAAEAGQEALKSAEIDLPGYEKALVVAKERFDLEQGTTKAVAESNLLVATTSRDYERISQILSNNAAASTLDYDIRKQGLDIDQQSLDTKLSLGTITQQQYETQTNSNKLKEIELDTAQQLNLALSEYITKTIAFNKELASGNITAQRIAEIEADRTSALKFYTDSTEKIKTQSVALTDQVNVLGKLTVKQKAYEDIFKSSFDNMADAIVQFAQTGKISFGDLINTMIADIARFELRQQTTSIWMALRPAIMSMIPGSSTAPEQLGGPGGPSIYEAKGGAYDYGIRQFAKGGAFTNQIVDSPTLFKFAKGTGMMGEAGPEAIMPLKRDGQGNLGIRGGSGGSNVEVVVNNYGTEKAETRETVDSRGNRKIEVTIGDMTAGEISRSGSASQKAVGGTFGLKPQLIRR
jgi:hypothetical protein